MQYKVLVTGVTGMLSKETANRLRKESDFKVEQISLRNSEWKNYDFSNVQTLVHVVGVTPGNIKEGQDYFEINQKLTCALAKKAKEQGVNHFVYISSMAVYGVEQNIKSQRGTISYNTPCNPNSDYGKSKYMAEQDLITIEDEKFKVTIVRVPSIYAKGKTEYLDQFKYLADKLSFIPIVFSKNYKSSICIENLCELIYLIVKEKQYGIVCPDDGQYSAVDYCSAIYPNKKKKRFFGKLMELFLKRNARIIDYYGSICYDLQMTEIFEGKYRVVPFQEAIRKAYER